MERDFMTKNYFTDEQVNAIHKEICRLEDLDSGISMPFQPLNNIEIANLRRIMNLAVETAIGNPKAQAYVNYDNECEQIDWFEGRNIEVDDEFTPLYSVKELDN